MSAVALSAHKTSRRIPAELSELAGVRDQLQDALLECGWSEHDRFRVLICADEAMANAVAHGADERGDVDVRFTVSQTTALLMVADDHDRHEPLTTPTAPPCEASEHGRGLIIMRAFADRMRVWTRRPGVGVAMAFHPEGT